MVICLDIHGYSGYSCIGDFWDMVDIYGYWEYLNIKDIRILGI